MAGTRRASEGVRWPEGPRPRRLRRRGNDGDPARQAPGRDRRDDHEHYERGLGESLGADVVVDYKKDDFATVLSDYDVVLDSRGGETLEKSLRVVEPGGLVIGIGGPPDPDFAKELGAPRFLRMAMTLLSRRIRMRARRRGVRYSFLRSSSNRLGFVAHRWGWRLTTLLSDPATLSRLPSIRPSPQLSSMNRVTDWSVRVCRRCLVFAHREMTTRAWPAGGVVPVPHSGAGKCVGEGLRGLVTSLYA